MCKLSQFRALVSIVHTKSVGPAPPRAVGVTFGSRSVPLEKRGHGPHGKDVPAKGSECKFLFIYHLVKLNLYTSETWLSSLWRLFPQLWQCKMSSRGSVTFLSPLNLMPWLQRDLVLHKRESHGSSHSNSKCLGCGIMPSSCCLGNPIIITPSFNFLTSWWLIFQPEFYFILSLSHHLIITNEKRRE